MAIWQPQPGPQSLAIAAAWCPEMFFGGARGGGKSDFLLGDFLQDTPIGPAWRGIMFRRSYKELEELVTRGKEMFLPLGAVWRTSQSVFEFPSGATLKLRYLEREDDADNYQGHQYTWIGFDELTNWANQNAYNKLKACLRSATLPPGYHKRIRCSGNPGGPGHTWVKEYFIDEAPQGKVLIGEKKNRMFIPSKLTDNRILTTNDPEYEGNLRELGSEELIKAWLDGDWSVITGAYFNEFSMKRHVIKPFKVPLHWTKFRSGDWGSYYPYSFGWWAVSDGWETPDGLWLPQGAIIRYREWYGYGGRANKGIKITGTQAAKGILDREKDDGRIDYGVLDPSAWKEDNGPSVAESMARSKVYFRRADNKRVNGWNEVRNRLVGSPDEGPMMYFFETCTHTIRTFPALPHDTNNPEDVDTNSEDHAGDDVRYACMSRPYAGARPQFETPIKTIQTATLDELWAFQALEDRRYAQI